ncbi:MAG: transketolase [Mycobacterium leprae]
MATSLTPELSRQCVNTIKMLAVDAVEKAKSGHPGAPMGDADMAFVLFSRFMRFNPDEPNWPNRDRFVLSNGHASMLLYSMLHLTGYDLSLDDLKQFRQWGSRTPGHPEYGHTPGVETTTGPLGQGISTAVGLATAAELAAARYNTADFSPVDHYIYGICGDGDLMEGVSAEAASLAGTWGLGRLIFLYDSNDISIEGNTDISFKEDVAKRFEAYGWQIQKVNGHDHEEIARAIKNAQDEKKRPSLIICKTTIGQGSPGKQGKESSHGAPLGADEVKATKANIGWPEEPTFLVPDEVRAYFAGLKAEKKAQYEEYQAKLSLWASKNPEKAIAWERSRNYVVPADLAEQLVKAAEGPVAATRKLSERVLQKAAELAPWLVGGSADLAESTLTIIKSSGHAGPCGKHGNFECSWEGRNFHFGVREFAMGTIVNGITLYGGFRGYGATFFVFSDYMRSAVRSAALMHIPAIFVWTHDSIFLGEDGPTHQPVEHLTSLRAIPGLTLFRPADGLETAMAWAYALSEAKGPVAFALTRQNVPILTRPDTFTIRDVWKGAYVVSAPAGAQATLIATGSEVGLALEAQKLLQEKGIAIRVVSMPSVELFDAQPKEYKDAVLGGPQSKVATLEAGITIGWYKYAGRDGLTMGLDRFGASAPADRLAKEFGFTPDLVATRIEAGLMG